MNNEAIINNNNNKKDIYNEYIYNQMIKKNNDKDQLNIKSSCLKDEANKVV